jgi:hypothetical protein
MKAETVTFNPQMVNSVLTPRGASGRPPVYARVVGGEGATGGGGKGEVMIKRSSSADGVEEQTQIQPSPMPRFIRSLSSG